MNVLSVFDGMSCGQIALRKAGIFPKKYFASEIDKHAIRVTQSRFPKTIQLGDVTQVKAKTIGKINLLIGGSPCQGFSFLGKRLNLEDPRSRLFFEFLRLKNELKPDYFLLENVRMGKEQIKIISSFLEVEPVLINSKVLCAQSRPRLYWTNIPLNPVPNKIVTVNSIIEKDFDSSLLLPPNWINRLKNSSDLKKGFSKLDPEIASCLTARMYKNWKGNFITTPQGIRRLSPVECERLQTVPDNYTKSVSDGERYKMLGNGWTVDVIAHLFSGLKNQKEISMKVTKNILRLKKMVRAIIDEGMDDEARFDVLTSIGLGTTNEDLFLACEDVRNDIVEEIESEKIADDVW